MVENPLRLVMKKEELKLSKCHSLLMFSLRRTVTHD